MKWFVPLLIGLGIAFHSAARADDSTERLAKHELQVFRLSGAFKSNTSLGPGGWGVNEQNEADKRDLVNNQNAVTLFDSGKFRWGRNRLELNDKGCFWNKTKLEFDEEQRPKLPDRQVRLISSHAVVRPLGNLIRLKIDSDSPFQYFERQPDGLFALKETTLPVGMDVEIRAIPRPEGGYRITYLELELRSVGSRESIDGVSLPVGRPLMREWEYVTRFNVSPHQGYGVLIRPQGTTGAMLIRVAISEAAQSDSPNQ